MWVDQATLTSPDGRLKDKATLAAMFAQAGNKPTIAYCNTGHLGAADWFVLSEVLQHPRARLYDGSMSEWTADPSRPVVR
jgi:thiosulfate/3-mercaptopyruvate sulfurtransferase